MMEMFSPNIVVFAEYGEQPTTVVECYKRVRSAKFILNQIKEEKDRRSEARGKKKGQNSEDAVKPSTSKSDHSGKKKEKFLDPRINKTQSKKRSYVHKAYYRKCQRNYVGVYRGNIVTCFYFYGKGHFARNCPNKKSNKDKKNQ